MIYIFGDLHGYIDISKLNAKNFTSQKNLTKDDYVIICGDFGCIWDGSKSDASWINWLEQKRFTTLFVDGNHENFNLLYQYPIVTRFGGKVGAISDSVYHLRRGEIYNIDNKKVFSFGGARSDDIDSRIKNISWWKAEMPSKVEMDYGLNNLILNNYTVDIVISHTCPSTIFNEVKNSNKQITELEKYLDTIRQLLDKYRINYHWYFGHFHTDLCIEEKFNCLYQKYHKIC